MDNDNIDIIIIIININNNNTTPSNIKDRTSDRSQGVWYKYLWRYDSNVTNFMTLSLGQWTKIDRRDMTQSYDKHPDSAIQVTQRHFKSIRLHKDYGRP